MKTISWIGLVVLILGVLSFVVPLPHSESHGVKVGDASVGITTKSNEKVPPVVGGILCLVGAVMLVGGARR